MDGQIQTLSERERQSPPSQQPRPINNPIVHWTCPSMPPKKNPSVGSKSTKKSKSDDSPESNHNNNKAMTKEEEEEMSSALIAQLLAQEGGEDQHGYYAEYNNSANYGRLGGSRGSRDDDYSDDDDDDYRHDYNYKPKSKSKRSANSQARKKTKKTAAPAKAAPPPPTPAKKKEKPATEKAETSSISDAQEPGKDTTTTAGATTIDATMTATETVAVKTDSSSSAVQGPEVSAAVTAPSAINDAAAVPIKPTAAAPVFPKAKPVKEAAPGLNTGVYSESEEKAFLEALELHGRNWKSVEEHVATRDANSIRSHAQKHFIKLFRDNIPLPAKVLESGPGYTLSGNDLDPYSAAARPYLIQKLADDPDSLPVQGGTVFTPMSGANAKAEKAAQAKEKKAVEDAAKAAMKDAMKDLKELKIKKQERPEKPERTIREQPLRPQRTMRADSPPELTYTGRTDYSKARLRNTRDRSSINFRQMASDLDPLTMVKCEPFCGQPNSGVVGCQPFGIKVQSNVLLGMDFHAHLMTTEIIGFLAGEWSPETRTIHIQAIFPCRSLPTGQNHVNVEMDPTSEFEVRQEIEKRNMRIVGWYHSHPTFTPDPSLVDIENQTSYQSLFKDEVLNEEPFVGAIVGPYDERLPGLSSVINWFYISQSAQERGHPKRLLYDLIEDTELPLEESALWTKLFDEYRDSPERTNFNEQWRQEETETRLQKMLVSLGRRMPWLRDNLMKKNSSNNSHGGDKETSTVETAAVEERMEVDASSEKAEPADQSPVSEDASEKSKIGGASEDAEMTAFATEKSQAAAPMEGVESSLADQETQKKEDEEGIKDKEEKEENEDKDVKEEKVDKEGKEEKEDEEEKEEEEDKEEKEGKEGKVEKEHLAGGESMSRSSSSISIMSSSSGSSRSYAGLAGLLNDPFLIQIEQELSSWEPVY
ncbi:hypothetical protein BGZ83_006220 [Gryganskiella cystojenkinii]|nr:hypothetical protein BGZ83_006220 [Gryganskiella cystojenkinii]